MRLGACNAVGARENHDSASGAESERPVSCRSHAGGRCAPTAQVAAINLCVLTWRASSCPLQA